MESVHAVLKGNSLNWSKWMRLTHRWLSIAFTLAVAVNGVTVVQGKYSRSLGLFAVFTLALQFLSGMYLFVLPYAAKWRRRGHSDGASVGA
jgi:hypothetical protein